MHSPKNGVSETISIFRSHYSSAAFVKFEFVENTEDLSSQLIQHFLHAFRAAGCSIVHVLQVKLGTWSTHSAMRTIETDA